MTIIPLASIVRATSRVGICAELPTASILFPLMRTNPSGYTRRWGSTVTT